MAENLLTINEATRALVRNLAFDALAAAPARGTRKRQTPRTPTCAPDDQPEDHSCEGHRSFFDPWVQAQRRPATRRARQIRDSEVMSITRGVLWDSNAILASRAIGTGRIAVLGLSR
jgi:hypothetical protein